MSLDNVLFSDDLRVSGIVDFGDMTHAPLVCDLAVAVADVLHGRDDAIEAADALIGGYVSVTPLEDEEAGLLADLVTARLATEVTVTAWRQRLYPDNVGYAASGEPGARAFLDAIEAMGIDAVARRFREACRRLPYRRSATSALLERRRRALPRSPLFYSRPVHLVRGEGVWLFDPDDRRYLDCYNNVAVAGHSHPRVVQAVTQQQQLLATHSRYLHEAIVHTVAGDIKFGIDGEWAKPRFLFVQFQGIKGNDLAQFRNPGTYVVLYPEEYKSNATVIPYDEARSR